MKKSLVRNWMTSDVITVAPETHLYDARRIMDAEKVRALPVMKNHALKGIVTRRDLLRADLSTAQLQSSQTDRGLKDALVERVMSQEVVQIDSESPVAKAARVMMENKIEALPVFENHKDMVGIITSSDLFRVIEEEVPQLERQTLVRNYMSYEPVTITADESLLEVHRIMGWKRIRALPVIDQDGKLIGIVTRTDVMSADPSRLYNRGNQEQSLKVQGQSVQDVMTASPITIKENAPITEAARLMRTHKFHSLPVVDERGDLIGIITDSDLFRLIVRKFFD
jgi:acetoin utilization protein AcuB